MTDDNANKNDDALAGWIFYDGACGLCRRLVRLTRPILGRRGFRYVPLQDEFARDRLGLAPGEMPEEMKLLTKDGRVLGAIDASLFLAANVWWAAPAALIGRLPGARHLLQYAYRFIASHRHQLGGNCSLQGAESCHPSHPNPDPSQQDATPDTDPPPPSADPSSSPTGSTS
jgi:predicted DCC family thiol-disulfide oxidoreductase YuxK